MIKTYALEHYNPEQRISAVREPLVEELCGAIERSGLTYKALAEKASVSIMTISRWVSRDTLTPRISTMVLVGHALGLELRWVSTGKKH